MGNYNRKVLIALAAVLIVTFGAVSVFAASNVSTVQAYRGVKIIFNGTQLTSEIEPYVINNSTYVPIRMLMEKFGKDIAWDAANQQVIITDNATEKNKDEQIRQLQNQIATLNAKVSGLESALGEADTTIRGIRSVLNEYDNVIDDTPTSTTTSISKLQSKLSDYFADAGDDYFGDSGIEVGITLRGDEDDMAYTIKMDFQDADDYDNLKGISQTKLKSFLNAVKSKLANVLDGTDYEDADITGKLSDNDISGYYVTYNGSSYKYSWDDTSTLSDITEYLNDKFEGGGDTYFGDDGIDVEISLSGDEDDLAYTIYLNFDNAENYDDLSDTSQTHMRNIMNNVKSAINTKIADSDYEDADITGLLIDDEKSNYYVRYNGSTYSFSW